MLPDCGPRHAEPHVGGPVADAEQIARHDASGRREDDAGGMHELLQLRIEAVVKTNCVSDRLHGIEGAGQEMPILRGARGRIALQIFRLGRGGVSAGLRRIDAQGDQRVVAARHHSGRAERIEQVGANDAAKIGATEVAKCKDQRLSFKKIVPAAPCDRCRRGTCLAWGAWAPGLCS